MAIYKIKGSPYYWYDFTIGGVRFRDSTKTDNRKQAEAIYAKRRSEAVIGQHYDMPDKITLNAAFGRFWEEHAQHLKSGLNSVSGHIQHIMGYFGKDKGLHQIGQGELASYVAACRTQQYTRKIINKRTGEPSDKAKPMIASPATINRRVAIFRGMHKKAQKWKVQLQHIDFSELKLAEPEAPDNPLSRDEAASILQAAPEHLLHFIMFSIYTGLRKSCVLELGKDHLDIFQKKIFTYGKSRKPGGKRINATIPDPLLAHILEYDLHLEEFCITYNGKPIKSIHTAWKQIFEDTGIDYRRPHDLRHTFATWLYQSTKDIMLVKERLHHASIATTMRYAHSQEGDDARVNAALSNINSPKSRQNGLKGAK